MVAISNLNASCHSHYTFKAHTQPGSHDKIQTPMFSNITDEKTSFTKELKTEKGHKKKPIQNLMCIPLKPSIDSHKNRYFKCEHVGMSKFMAVSLCSGCWDRNIERWRLMEVNANVALVFL